MIVYSPMKNSVKNTTSRRPYLHPRQVADDAAIFNVQDPILHCDVGVAPRSRRRELRRLGQLRTRSATDDGLLGTFRDFPEPAENIVIFDLRPQRKRNFLFSSFLTLRRGFLPSFLRGLIRNRDKGIVSFSHQDYRYFLRVMMKIINKNKSSDFLQTHF